MAVAGPISGVGGFVTINKNVIGQNAGAPAEIGLIRSWNADFRRDVTPNDIFETSSINFKKFIGGMFDIVGTCEGWMDSVGGFVLQAAANLVKADYIPTAGTDNILLVLRQGTTDLGYTFDAILSNVNMRVVKGSEFNQFTLSFQSTGVIVQTDYVA